MQNNKIVTIIFITIFYLLQNSSISKDLISSAITSRQMFFIDTNTGWVVGEKGVILKTTDSGLHWIE